MYNGAGEFSVRSENNADMSKKSYMKTGGRAKTALYPADADELISSANSLFEKNIQFRILGNCTNVLFPDGDIGFIPIFSSDLSGMKPVNGGDGGTCVFCEAGANLTSLAKFCADSSLSGLEFAYGIPGSLGGGIFMNAGAYGGELADVISEVNVYDLKEKKRKTLTNAECSFSYRQSIFQASHELMILSAKLCLSPGDRDAINAVCLENMNKRRQKQPLEYPSLGSAFKRPEGYFAGKLIADAGLKGVNVGGAYVSEKHAGFIINKGNATSKDVRELIGIIIKTVEDKFSVTLTPEIEIL